MSCCSGCAQPATLGAYPVSGYSIPYHYSASELSDFLNRHTADSDGKVVSYVNTGIPQWGIVVRESYGDILLWRDASNVLHAVDVTNLSIVAQVEAAPFVSPQAPGAASFFEDIAQQFKALFNQALGVLEIGVLVVGAYFVYQAVRR